MANSEERERSRLPDTERLWKLLDSSPYELATVVIHLAWRCGLSRREIWSLKWDEVDFENAFLHLPDRDVPVEKKTLRQLRLWRSICGSGESEYSPTHW